MFQLLKKASALVAVATMIFAGPVALAAAPGGLEMGDFYRGKNDTKNSAFSDPVNADPCDAITLRMRLHNPGPSPISAVNVKATVPSGTGTSFSSAATVTSANADPQTVTDTVAIHVSKSAKINYVPGSTQLLDANGGAMQTLPDGAIQSGVNIGDIGVSTQQMRFVQFKLKLDCETPVCPPGTTGTPPNCVEPQKNVVCDSLVAEYIGGTKVPAKLKFTAKGTATGGATINGYAFDFGDGAKEDSANGSLEHTYNKEGEYKATAQVKSSLGVTAVSANCSVTIKVSNEQPPVVTPNPSVPGVSSPSSLPSTGPVEVISGFLGTGSLGYGIRQWLMSRRRLGDVLNQ